MGLRPSEKGKKSEGLAVILRHGDPNERTPSTVAEKHDALNSAVRYVLNADSNAVFAEGGTILYDTVEATLKTTVQHFTGTHGPAPLREGRLGPVQVEVDREGTYGPLAISSSNRFAVESKGNFSSCRATHCFFAGKWMYEAVVGTGGIQQIGWATRTCRFNREEGVGDDEDSYAFDGKRVKKWNVTPASYGQSWAPGDVIGCCADFDEGDLTFYRNGRSMGTAFRDVRTLKPDLGYFPAISLSEDEKSTLNFGGKPFYYPIDGYAPCDDGPPEGERLAVEYLMQVLERLTEMQASGPGPLTSTAFPLRSRLPTDEAVLVAAVVVQQLRPFLQSVYHVLHGVLSSVKRVLGGAGVTSTTNLSSMMELLSNALGPVEFDALVLRLLEHAAESAVVFPFRASELPYTASHASLTLFVALLKSASIRRIFVQSDRAFPLLEMCLARKKPTNEDLKELLPSVWWKGCKDETMSEEIMNSLVSTLSTSYLKIEQLHFELLMMMVSEDLAQKDSLLRRPKLSLEEFLNYLLHKNTGAARNVPPPGLSSQPQILKALGTRAYVCADPTVMVSVFHFLMVLLQPYLVLQKTEETDILEEYPVKELFLSGCAGEATNGDQELPRLGGLPSYLIKKTEQDLPNSVSVVIDPDITGHEATRCQLPKGSIPKLLHIALLAFRLGPETAIKLCTKQFQAESGLISALSKMEWKLTDPKLASKEKSQLMLDTKKQKEEVIKAVRESAWCKVVWLTASKQRFLFLLIVYVSKLMASIAASPSELLLYVPEVYVEAVVRIFQVLAGTEARFASLTQLEVHGLQHVFSLFVTHFNHPRIINPQVSDSILQALITIFGDKEFLKVCQKNPDARQHLIVGLLKGFDTRHWLSISNIFLSIGKGTGFGHASSLSGSPVFREFFATTCAADLSLLDGFLNRLFTILNWTLMELAIVMGELAELLSRSHGSFSLLSRQPRKASLLFTLSTDLLRLLELVAGQVPAAFLTGSKINITRVVEAVAYVLSHATTGSDSTSFNTVLKAAQAEAEWKSKISRAAILAPVAGILVFLHNNESRLARPLEAENSGGEMHSIVKILLEKLSCSTECLYFLSEVDWKATYVNIQKKSCWLPRLHELLADYNAEKSENRVTPEMIDTDDVPEAFLDPIQQTIMTDPVVLPDSKVTVDRATIERHLLTSATDPFSRAELTREMLIPDASLRDKIAQWIDEKCNRS